MNTEGEPKQEEQDGQAKKQRLITVIPQHIRHRCTIFAEKLKLLPSLADLSLRKKVVSFISHVLLEKRAGGRPRDHKISIAVALHQQGKPWCEVYQVTRTIGRLAQMRLRDAVRQRVKRERQR